MDCLFLSGSLKLCRDYSVLCHRSSVYFGRGTYNLPWSCHFRSFWSTSYVGILNQENFHNRCSPSCLTITLMVDGCWSCMWSHIVWPCLEIKLDRIVFVSWTPWCLEIPTYPWFGLWRSWWGWLLWCSDGRSQSPQCKLLSSTFYTFCIIYLVKHGLLCTFSGPGGLHGSCQASPFAWCTRWRFCHLSSAVPLLPACPCVKFFKNCYPWELGKGFFDGWQDVSFTADVLA